MSRIYSVMGGSGSYIPTKVVKNNDFIENSFYDSNGQPITTPGLDVVQKFKNITLIEERRYATDDLVASDLGAFAAREAIESSKYDRESFDYIIVAHNFGDIKSDFQRIDTCPTIAARIKQKLEIQNPYTVAYDLPFGCAGWVQALIQADYFIRSGDAKRILVVACETLSRVSDPHDRDSMIYSDGAGAVILEACSSVEPVGIIAHKTRSDTLTCADLLKMGPSYNLNHKPQDLYLKMNGRRVYEYALKNVPTLVADCIKAAHFNPSDIKKVLIHQANAKMDEAILQRLFELFGSKAISQEIMPMTIGYLGNNSVATVPILFDLINKGKLGSHKFNPNDKIILTSVGAGMNINAIAYKFPNN